MIDKITHPNPDINSRINVICDAQDINIGVKRHKIHIKAGDEVIELDTSEAYNLAHYLLHLVNHIKETLS